MHMSPRFMSINMHVVEKITDKEYQNSTHVQKEVLTNHCLENDLNCVNTVVYSQQKYLLENIHNDKKQVFAPHT